MDCIRLTYNNILLYNGIIAIVLIIILLNCILHFDSSGELIDRMDDCTLCIVHYSLFCTD